MQESSRVTAGRRRAARAKRTIALAAAGGFLAVFGLARISHPGTTATGSVTTGSSPSSSVVQQSDDGGESDDGTWSSGTIAPSTSSSVPQVQTRTS